MRKIMVFIAASLLMIGCNGKAQNRVENLPPKIYSGKLASENNPQLIDVRTPQEFAGEHLDNAKNINWNGGNFEKEVASLDKSKPVYVYCKVGGRSSEAAARLSEMGFEKIYNLDGGILKWNAEGFSKPAAKGIGMSKPDFDKLVTTHDKILISFFAEWCAPCKKMAPYMNELEKNPGKMKVVRLDADANKSLVSEMKIAKLPTLLLYQDGKIVWQHTGFISEADLKKQLR